MANVHDVATYTLEITGQITVMKLHKLVFYCQAWSMVWQGRPIFPEKIIAEGTGPIIKELYEKHSDQFKVGKWSLGETKNLCAEDRLTVEMICTWYGKFKTNELAALIRSEEPWKSAISNEITPAMLKRYDRIKDPQKHK